MFIPRIQSGQKVHNKQVELSFAIHRRIKRMIIRHDGFKVFPSMIEKTIGEIPDVERCYVVGSKDSNHTQGKLPVAYVVLKKDRKGAENQIKEELQEICKNELPEYAQPVGYFFVDQLPLTNIGKVDYQELERRATGREERDNR